MRWMVLFVAALAFGCEGESDGGESDSEDESCQERCRHGRDGFVPLSECSRAQDPERNHDVDPRSDPPGQSYWQTAENYRLVLVGDCESDGGY